MEGAVVTGAAGGIGKRIAAALAADGWRVAVLDRDPKVLEVAAAEGWHGQVADVVDGAAVEAAIATAEEAVGPLGALVSNAAIVDQIHPALDFPLEGWERELAVNLTGAFRVCQAAARGMTERGGGRIVAISSGAAEAGLPGQVAYSASKAGLLGMVRTLAIELGRDGVSVNAILPGLIESEKVAAMPEAITRRVVKRTALGRTGRMEEVAALAAFLCSEPAGYITGACIPIDGGGGLNTVALAGR
jgi:NAD(P)-dependent dehydrogenase (short-subunit alcohol dehydrogenase family)